MKENLDINSYHSLPVIAKKALGEKAAEIDVALRRMQAIRFGFSLEDAENCSEIIEYGYKYRLQ